MMVLALWVGGIAPAAANDYGRYVNLTDWFTWPRFAGFDKPGLLTPVFDPKRHARGRLAIQDIRRQGFRGIRLGVDPSPFWAADEPGRSEAWNQVFVGINAALDAGLNVVVDLHPNSRHKLYGEAAVARGATDDVFTAYANVVAMFAQRLSQLPAGRVALELMNEPRLKCTGVDQQNWQGKLDSMIAVARAASSTLPLVVTGSCISAIEGLLALDAKRWQDPNLIFTFHYYEPFVFTHQGAPFIPWPEKYLGNLPWPAAPPADPDAELLSADARLPAMGVAERELARLNIRRVLQRYSDSKAARSLIEKRFAQVSAWADAGGIARRRIFLGEFGVYTRGATGWGADCSSRARWTKDVREIAEAQGFGWSFFHYDGPFGFMDSRNRKTDSAVLAALGLSPTGNCAVE